MVLGVTPEMERGEFEKILFQVLGGNLDKNLKVYIIYIIRL